MGPQGLHGPRGPPVGVSTNKCPPRCTSHLPTLHTNPHPSTLPHPSISFPGATQRGASFLPLVQPKGSSLEVWKVRSCGKDEPHGGSEKMYARAHARAQFFFLSPSRLSGSWTLPKKLYKDWKIIWKFDRIFYLYIFFVCLIFSKKSSPPTHPRRPIDPDPRRGWGRVWWFLDCILH